jgi:hypothetical protein
VKNRDDFANSNSAKQAAAIIIHLPSFALVLAFAIATLGVAAALVHDGFDDYPVC